jgi:hypothetical protein
MMTTAGVSSSGDGIVRRRTSLEVCHFDGKCRSAGIIIDVNRPKGDGSNSPNPVS